MNSYPICPKCATRDKQITKDSQNERICHWCGNKYELKQANIVSYGTKIRGDRN